MLKGQQVKNKHTGEVCTILDIDYVPISSKLDIQPIWVLSDSTRWDMVSMTHWELCLVQNDVDQV